MPIFEYEGGWGVAKLLILLGYIVRNLLETKIFAQIFVMLLNVACRVTGGMGVGGVARYTHVCLRCVTFRV